MKKFVLITLCLNLLFSISLNAQSTDANGQKRFKGNVAIFINSDIFSFRNGLFYMPEQFNESLERELKKDEASLYALLQQNVSNAGYAVVNRDDKMQEKVNLLLQQNKMEEYIDGISVQAKKQGADYILLADVTHCTIDESYVCMEYSLKMLNVSNNMGTYTCFRTDLYPIKTTNDMRGMISSFIHEFNVKSQSFLSEYSLEQYAVAAISGKKLTLLAYQPNGAIKADDKFYVFDVSKNYTIKDNGTDLPIIKLDPMSVASNPRLEGGNLTVTSSNNVKDKTTALVFRQIEKPKFGAAVFLTYFGFDVKDSKTFEGFYKKRINLTINYAISANPFTEGIEQDMLPSLRAERELQKTEDFLNGHTVEQMKAIGAAKLLHVENFNVNGEEISFVINCVDVASNTIEKSIEVKGNAAEIESIVLQKMLTLYLAPCWIDNVNKKNIELHSAFRLSLPKNTPCKLFYVKETKNPLTNESAYNRVELCTIRYAEYHGNYHVYEIDKILDKESMRNIEQIVESGAKFLISVDGLEENVIFKPLKVQNTKE